MALTPRHGKETIFKVGTKGAPTVLTDISAFLDSVTYPQSADTVETTTFGNKVRSYMPGFQGNAFSISGKYDASSSPNIDTILSDLQQATVPVAVSYVPGGGSGPTYNAPGGSGAAGVWLSNYSVSSPVNDVVSFSADFVGNLAITRTP